MAKNWLEIVNIRCVPREQDQFTDLDEYISLNFFACVFRSSKIPLLTVISPTRKNSRSTIATIIYYNLLQRQPRRTADARQAHG
jgi:hypothetical protein